MSDRNKNGAGKGDLSRRVKRKNWDKGWEMAFGKGKKKKVEEDRGKDENENKKMCSYCGKSEEDHSEKLCSTY